VRDFLSAFVQHASLSPDEPADNEDSDSNEEKARNSGDNDVDPARSAQMALVRGRDTKPEIRVRKALHAAGLRYRLHDKKLPGSPDLVFPGQSVRASHADMTRSVSTKTA
jgi:hypothetical protein